jgi:hypothetical protein
MLIGAIAIIWVLIWALVLVDIIRRKDLNGKKKVAWALIVLILPIIGVIIYMVIRPPDVHGIDELASSDSGMRPGEETFERARDRHPF